MRNGSSIALVLFSVVALGACDGDDPCLYGADSLEAAPTVEPPQLRNPQTGQCESFYNNYPPYDCDESCGPCDYPAAIPQAPPPTWGVCYAGCEGQNEDQCLDNPSCRAVYLDACPPNADCDGYTAGAYVDCWSIDTLGPAQGPCDGLDAQSCSAHNDCVAIHSNLCTDPNANPFGCAGNFLACAPEPEDCVGDACNNPAGECYAEVASCLVPVPECPADTLPGVKDGCYTGYCIPVDQCEIPTTACAEVASETQCIIRPDCSGTYEGLNCSCNGDVCNCAEWIYQGCGDMSAP